MAKGMIRKSGPKTHSAMRGAAIAVALLVAGPAPAAPENAEAPDGAGEFGWREGASDGGVSGEDGFAAPGVDSPYVPRIDGVTATVPRVRRTVPGDAQARGEAAPIPPDPVTGTRCIAPPVETASFAEEFDLPLDVSAWGPGTRWIAHTPWNGDFGEARFRDPGEGGPFTVEHGILTIEARQNAAGEWGSGLLASVDREGRGFTQLYGYFEARARLPAAPGVWPAFWLIGADRSRFTAEIDVMEYRGAKPDGYTSSLHVWNRGGRPHDKQLERHVVFGGREKDGRNHVDRFNTYGVHVGPERTTFYFNRCPVWTAETRAEHRQPMFMLVNLALGGSFPIDETPSPTRMEVDHVRAWPLGAVREEGRGQ